MNARWNAVMELARRYDYDAGHAHQVECLAGTLFMELWSLHQLGPDDRKLLEYAAILHDIGGYISTRGHHRHALQMILTEPWTEFSRDEKTVIANLARYHRKAPPAADHTLFAILSEEDKRRVLLMAPILRIADALDRSHRCLVQELACELQEDTVVLHVGAEEEMPIEAMALKRKCGMFQQVYQRDVQLKVVRPRMAQMDSVSPVQAVTDYPSPAKAESAGPTGSADPTAKL